jgi:hypothetical protein
MHLQVHFGTAFFDIVNQCGIITIKSRDLIKEGN